MSSIEEFKELDDFLHDLPYTWGIPGVAVVVLKDKKVIYSKAFGYRDVANKLEMTTKTIQPIASCTKAFTTAAIAMLVEEGKLEWDKPIRKYVPEFELNDSVVSNRITLEDMLSHRTGLPRHDFVWMNTNFTYNQVLERLPFLEPSKDLRTTFQYNNLMFMAASMVIKKISGVSYNEFVENRIFKPLSMENSNFSITEMQKAADFAYPYKEKDGETVLCDFVDNDVASGAGCINSSIEDMGKWLQFHLNTGKVGEEQLVSPDNIKRTHKPLIITALGSGLDMWIPDQKWIKLQTYALGWAGEIYRGYRTVGHGGGIDGSSSLMTFIPDEDIGVGVIVNKTGSMVPTMVTYHILDRLLELENVDWNGLLKPIEEQVKKIDRETGSKSQELRVLKTKPTFEFHEYTGKYHHPGYGELKINLEGEELTISFGEATYPLTHYHFDTFQFDYKRFDLKDLLTFQLDSNGEVDCFTIKLESLVPPVKFTRLPDEHFKDKEFLNKLVGKYNLASIEIVIAFKSGDKLTIAFPNQPAVELVPVKGMRFKIKGSEATALTFKETETGDIDEFLFVQLGTVISAKRIKE